MICRLLGQTTTTLVLLGAAVYATAQARIEESAQNFPSRPVRILVPYVPGGAVDITARLISTKASAELKQQFIVDNRPGGNTTIATGMVARAAPDGYTLGIVDSAFTIEPNLSVKLPYDPLRDFVPISILTSTAFVLAVHPSVPVKTVAQLAALSRSKPGQLAYSSGGSGSMSHLTLEQFKLVTGIDAVHVPFKGGAASANAVLSGEVSYTAASQTALVQYIKAGKLRALAVTSNRRLDSMPDVPTFAESKLNVEVSQFFGLVAPAGTPARIVTKLNETMVRLLRSTDMTARMAELGLEVIASSPEAFADYIRKDIPKWAQVVKAAGIKSE